jgi:hypothetical protein
MIQFLKPRSGGRLRPQRHIEVVEPIHAPLADVADWSDTALTDEEAVEIQRAFQQEVAGLSAVVSIVPELTVLDGGVAAADPLDLTQVDSLAVLEPDWPSVVWPQSAADAESAADLTEFRAQMDDRDAADQAVPQYMLESDRDTLDGMFAAGLAELREAAAPEAFTPPFDPAEIEALAIETVDLAALDAVEPELAEPELLEPEAIEPETRVDVEPAVALVEPLPELVVQSIAVDLPEMDVDLEEVDALAEPDAAAEVGLAIADLSDTDPSEADATEADVTDIILSESPIDWAKNENWASDAVDVAVEDAAAASAAATQTAPLTYFQYYLDDPAIGGTSDAGETPAPYVTPWRQPSMPGGLIGAGVLGATLVSGFVIADTVKTPPVTAVKRPTPPSPLQSLSARDQVMTTAALPKAMPPEAMKPEVALPPPKRGMTMTPVFSPPAPITQSMPLAPLGGAIAASRTSSVNDLPPSNGVVSNPAPTAPAKPSAPSGAVENQSGMPQTAPTNFPISQNPPTPPSTVGERTPSPSAPPTQSGGELPELQPEIMRPLPTTANPAAPTNEAVPPVVQPAPAIPAAPVVDAPRVPLADLTPTPVRSPLQPVEATSPAPASPAVTPPVETIVPTEVTTTPVEAAVDRSAALPADRVFNREAAPTVLPMDQAATPLPPATAAAQPIANRLSHRPTQAQFLLAQPLDNSYGTVAANQWRPLTEAEVQTIARQTQKMAEFTHRSVSLDAYRQAYASVSQTVDSLPTFGFIDFQRRLVILPPSSESVRSGAVASRMMSL